MHSVSQYTVTLIILVMTIMVNSLIDFYREWCAMGISYAYGSLQKLENMKWTIQQVEMDLKRLPDNPST